MATNGKASPQATTQALSAQDALMSLITSALQGKGTDWAHQDTEILREGTKIVLPSTPGPMPIPAAIAALQRKQKDEETEMAVHEVIDTYPMDGAVAFVKALREIYGWASPTPIMSWFGPQPPELLTVQTGPDTKVQVPWGEFTVPGIENTIGVSTQHTDTGPHFVIYGRVKKREQFVLLELAQRTREILARESIYKGQAIRLRTDSDGDIDHNKPPEFLPTSYIRPSELILNADELDQVDTALWTPIRHTAECVKHGIPLKRGVLLEGTYGTGKTMTANVTSKVCVQHGWTFILLDDVRALEDALLFAKRYSPAVVFAEDIDRLLEDRDQEANDLLNTIDGVLTKNSQVITVLTTNFVEKIDKAMLRPGRLDAVISIRTPDAHSVARLIHLYARGLMAEGEDLADVGTVLAGNIPATIREVVERSKLAMIAGGRTQITANDLMISAKGMKDHLTLLAEGPKVQSPAERLGSVLINALGSPDALAADLLRQEAQALKLQVYELRKNVVQTGAQSDHVARTSTAVLAEGHKQINKKLDTVVEAVVGN